MSAPNPQLVEALRAAPSPSFNNTQWEALLDGIANSIRQDKIELRGEYSPKYSITVAALIAHSVRFREVLTREGIDTPRFMEILEQARQFWMRQYNKPSPGREVVEILKTLHIDDE